MHAPSTAQIARLRALLADLTAMGDQVEQMNARTRALLKLDEQDDESAVD